MTKNQDTGGNYKIYTDEGITFHVGEWVKTPESASLTTIKTRTIKEDIADQDLQKRHEGQKLLTELDQTTITSNPKDLMGSRKSALSLVPYDCIKGISEALYYGAFKAKRIDNTFGYKPYNWRKTKVRLSIYLDAILRHTYALANGEDKDLDSGLPHEDHIGANVAIIKDAKLNNTLIDDRLDKRQS